MDVGYCSSRVTPIAEGQSLPAAASTRLLKGSEDITEYAAHTLLPFRLGVE